MRPETSAKLPGTTVATRARRRPGGAPPRWVALGAVVGAVTLGAACGGGSEATTGSETVAAGASTAPTSAGTAGAAATAVSTAAPAASTATTAPLPASLVGTWKREVTKADVARAHANGYLAGPSTLTVAADGAATINAAGIPFAGKLLATGDDEVQIALGSTSPNAYRWVVDGPRLTLEKRTDITADRIAVMEGVWQRA